MENQEKENTKNSIKEDAFLSSLKFHPIKDSVLLLVAIVVITVVFLSSYYSKPKVDKSTLFVQIKYQDVLLYDKNDTTKSTDISFPKEGEKKVSFTKEDSSLYLPEDTAFAFQGKGITFTLYSDYSIQVLHDDVECKDYDCARQGRIYNTYLPIVCLPNGIQAMIVSEKGGFPEFDA